MATSILPKLTILGGSSPFTIELVNNLYSKNSIGAYNLVLFGRNAENLNLICSYARYHLVKIGWSVDNTLDIDQALDGAAIIILQNRFGGIEGRIEDEKFARYFGFPIDETLGPCGLKSAIRMTRYLGPLAKRIVALCPDAILINLTNPLSIAVSILKMEGVNKVLGVCELPVTTLEKIAKSLDLATDKISWDYSGLNHRGFIYNLNHNGRNLFPDFLQKIKNNGFLGMAYKNIKHLEAIPLKYFQLFLVSSNPEGRAEHVKVIGDSIIQDLKLNGIGSPARLNDRNMDWYKDAVMPVLEALNSADPKISIVNRVGQDGLTIESKVRISKGTIEVIKSEQVPVQVNKWLQKFIAHEKAVLMAAVDPSPQNVGNALLLDPVISGFDINKIQKYLLKAL